MHNFGKFGGNWTIVSKVIEGQSFAFHVNVSQSIVSHHISWICQGIFCNFTYVRMEKRTWKTSYTRWTQSFIPEAPSFWYSDMIIAVIGIMGTLAFCYSSVLVIIFNLGVKIIKGYFKVFLGSKIFKVPKVSVNFRSSLWSPRPFHQLCVLESHNLSLLGLKSTTSGLKVLWRMNAIPAFQD